MHPLYDVATVTEDAADVFCVDGAGEMGVTVMPSVPAGCADPLKKTQKYRQVSGVDQWLQTFLCLIHPDSPVNYIKVNTVAIFFLTIQLLMFKSVLSSLHSKKKKI